jgi:hypothetical protein
MMAHTEETTPLISTSYRKPVFLAAIGFITLQIAVGGLAVRLFLLEAAAPEQVSFVTLLSVLHSGIWILAALGMFVWAVKAARRILRFPQDTFRYSRIFTGFLLVCTIVLTLRDVWFVSLGSFDDWQTTQGALVMMTLCVQVLTGLWSVVTAWLRVRGSGFAGPASVAALVFWTFAFFPAGLVGVFLYLVTRRHDGPDLDSIQETGQS